MEAEQLHTHDDWALWTISGGPNKGYHVTLKMNGQSIQMELDTGAAISFQKLSGKSCSQMYDCKSTKVFT